MKYVPQATMIPFRMRFDRRELVDGGLRRYPGGWLLAARCEAWFKKAVGDDKGLIEFGRDGHDRRDEVTREALCACITIEYCGKSTSTSPQCVTRSSNPRGTAPALCHQRRMVIH